jgi:hypothetical protein
MANRNSKRKAKLLSKEIARAHRDGFKVTPAPSQRRSKWKGVTNLRMAVASFPGFHRSR